MDLDKAIKETIRQEGQIVLLDMRFVNILNDLGAFQESPSTRFMMRSIINGGYMQKFLQLGGWNSQAVQLMQKIAVETGFNAEGIELVFHSIANGLDWEPSNEVSTPKLHQTSSNKKQQETKQEELDAAEREKKAKVKARAAKAAATRAANKKKKAEESAKEQERLKKEAIREQKKEDRKVSIFASLIVATVIISFVAFVIGCFMKSWGIIISFFLLFQISSGFVCYVASENLAKSVYITAMLLAVIGIVLGFCFGMINAFNEFFMCALIPELLIIGPLIATMIKSD
jgi:uncharacterized membrane protein